MTGEFLQMVIEPRSVQRFDGSTNAVVQQLSPFNQDGVVGYFLRKRVLKDVLRIRKGRLLVNEFAALQDSERAV